LHLSLLADRGSGKARQLTVGERGLDGFVGLAWTPENKIVFTGFGDNATNVFIMDPDGSNRVQLTSNTGRVNNHPAVSRDGRQIAFTSDRTGRNQIWRMDIDGRNQRQVTFGEGTRERAQYPALSPDGTEVYFIRYGEGPASIWKVSIEGGTPVPVSRLTDASSEGFLSISPDGKWLAYHHASAQPETRSEDRTLRIGVLSADGNAEPKLFDLPVRRPIVHWSEDSSGFYFAAGAFNSSSLWFQPLNGSDARKLVDFSDRVFNFAWSRDGKNLVLSRGRQQGDAILITNLP
jgi:TolB protein